MSVFDVQVPKYVKLNNTRLSVLYMIITFVVFVIVGGHFYYTEQFARRVPVAEYVNFDIWVNQASNPESMTAGFNARANHPLCKDPGSYAYWYDAEGVWTYEDHECARVCLDGEDWRDTNCLFPNAFFDRETPSKVFLKSEQQVFLYKKDSYDGRKVKISSSFFPSVEKLEIEFSIAFKVPIVSPWLPDQGDTDLRENTDVGSTFEGITLVYLDHQRNVYKLGDRTDNAKLTVAELLEMSGDRDALINRADDSPLNYKPGSRPLGPTRYIKGIDIKVIVECWQKEKDLWKDGKTYTVPKRPSDSAICYILVERNRGVWASLRRTYLQQDGSLLDVLAHGLRIEVQAHGYFSYWDFHSIYLNVIAALVILNVVPRAIIIFIATNLCGALSEVYSRVIFEVFNVGEQIGGTVARLLTTSFAYSELSHATDAGISRDYILHCLKETLKDRLVSETTEEGDKAAVLDLVELKAFASFAYRAIMHPLHYKKNLANHSKRKVKRSAAIEDLDLEDELEEDFKDPINIDKYMTSCSTLEPIGFEALVRLFDQNRPRHFLEKFLTPAAIEAPIRQEFVHSDKKAQDEDAAQICRKQSAQIKRRPGHEEFRVVQEKFDTLHDGHESLDKRLEESLQRVLALEERLQVELDQVRRLQAGLGGSPTSWEERFLKVELASERANRQLYDISLSQATLAQQIERIHSGSTLAVKQASNKPETSGSEADRRGSPSLGPAVPGSAPPSPTFSRPALALLSRAPAASPAAASSSAVPPSGSSAAADSSKAAPSNSATAPSGTRAGGGTAGLSAAAAALGLTPAPSPTSGLRARAAATAAFPGLMSAPGRAGGSTTVSRAQAAGTDHSNE